MVSEQLTAEKLEEIERKYDPETAFRPTGPILASIVSVALVAMSLYHFYASGFGLIRELLHRGIYLSFVLGLVFLLFGMRKTTAGEYRTLFSPFWRLPRHCICRSCRLKSSPSALAIRLNSMCLWERSCWS